MNTKPWLKTYQSNNIPATINSDVYPSVLGMLEQAMSQYAELAAFTAFGQTVTYAEVDQLSGALAAWLQKTGLKKGDRVAVMSPNFIAFPIVFLAIARIGAIQVNVNPLYTARELAHQLKDSGSETIFIFSGVSATLADAIEQTDIKNIITVAPGDGTKALLPSPPVDPRLNNTIALADALVQGNALERKPVVLNGDDLLFLQYTGGTTGLSKGAALSHRNLVANIEQYKSFMPDSVRSGQEVVVTAIPLYHIFALMVNFLTYFSVGAKNWLIANPRDMDGFVEVLQQAKPTVFMGVNTLYAGLCMHPKISEVDFSNLRLSGGGGAAVLKVTSDRWKAITGTFIREGYGLSETSPVVSFNPASIQDFSGTTGLPLPSTDIKLLDESNQEVAIGEPGEVCVKGPQVMQGYWNQAQANAAAFTADGYFRTGDVGVITPEGFLQIVDRKKDMVIVSGFNVFPNEIEAVAAACKGVAECACIGVVDEKTGEALKLFVVKAPNAQLSTEDLIAHCRLSLTAYKVPKLISFVDALPKSTVGKILRRELRDSQAT